MPDEEEECIRDKEQMGGIGEDAQEPRRKMPFDNNNKIKKTSSERKEQENQEERWGVEKLNSIVTVIVDGARHWIMIAARIE